MNPTRVVAIDPHKRTCAVAVVDATTGELLAQKRFANSPAGISNLHRWASEESAQRVFAIEDLRNLTGPLERHLLGRGENVIRVPARLTARARVSDSGSSKSDEVDARSIARAVLELGPSWFPSATIHEPVADIRVLVEYRASLVGERSAGQNRLYHLLFDVDPDLEAQIRRRSLRTAETVARLSALMQLQRPSVRLEVARGELARIAELNDIVGEVEADLRQRVSDHCPALLEIAGCGVVYASTIIGRVGDARRFPTDGHFARSVGAAPVLRGSGEQERLRTDHRGDRKLNSVLHGIAVSQRRYYPPAQEYLKRKVDEGKPPRHALRCLKRQIARRVWRALLTTSG